MLVERLKETGLSDRCWHVPARQVGSMLTSKSPPPTTVSWRIACNSLETCIREPPIHNVRTREFFGARSGRQLSSPNEMRCMRTGNR